ncbi:ankyrin repeat domain-containing protein 13c [Anaeramoeba flamelloides]|uniref:Ankyrin repeat domain-containing protein 13c n=1 Tax=Anaeramoeba flamelloides TaxID=1746091 RepID=A0AAV7ZPZ3_9EUKA|nr:ankyrin repeat domain-containing protein 13c [Anaeramoeba flamelloides]
MTKTLNKEFKVGTDNKESIVSDHQYQENIPLRLSDFDFHDKETNINLKNDLEGNGITFDQNVSINMGTNDKKKRKTKVTNEEFLSLVANDKYALLKHYLSKKLITDINARDVNNESSLIIAIQNDSYRMVKLLLGNGADPLVYNKDGWSAIQQATFFGNRKIIKSVYFHLQIKLHTLYENQLPLILEKIKQLPDFMMKMNWEMNTWFPFLTRILPNDEYIIWKCGSNIRVDCTLIGLDKKKWIRGSVSILLTGLDTSTPGEVFIIDHDNQTYFNTSKKIEEGRNTIRVTKSDIESLLENDMVKSIFNTKKLVFQRKKSWFGDKKKTLRIGKWNTKVFEIKNLIYEATIRQIKRNEKKKKQKKSLGSIPQFNLVKKSKNFSGTVCIANDFPLTIEKMMPIFKVLARTNEHFQKLKDFISIKPPFVGFPIKMELPVYSGISAIVTFPHFQKMDPDPELFEIPKGYKEINKLTLNNNINNQNENSYKISKKKKKSRKKKNSNKKYVKKKTTDQNNIQTSNNKATNQKNQRILKKKNSSIKTPNFKEKVEK